MKRKVWNSNSKIYLKYNFKTDDDDDDEEQ